jgi:O-antigen ligase
LFALAAGALVMLALSPRRLRLVCALVFLGGIPAIGVLLASRVTALTQRGATLSAASHGGQRLAAELAILAVAQAIVALGYLRVSSRIDVTARARRIFGAAVVALAAAAVAVGFVHYGSPVTIVHRAYHSFVSSPTAGANLNGRLFSLANDRRIVLWHAAWRDFVAHPIVGSGAGSYGAFWLAHRTTAYFVEDAHDLYLQTMAELGLVGLVLLVVFLVIPLIAAVRARRYPIVAPALGAYVAFLVHAAVDWDWQMPAVTLLALFVGAALVAAARRGEPRPEPMRRPVRLALGAAAFVVAAAAFVGLIGNIELARSSAAILDGAGAKAASDASAARSWAPWSADALLDLGEGRVLAGSKRSGLAAMRQAAADDPGDWTIWFDLAAATSGAEHRAALARAKALNPQSPEIADVVAAAKHG